MELRKVQALTSGSMYVTLPKVWVKRTQVQPGNVIQFSPMVDGGLALSRFQESGNSLDAETIHTLRLKSKMTPAQLKDHLCSCYALGHELIRLETTGAKLNGHVRAVMDAQRSLMGLNILEEETDSILLQVSLNIERFNLNQLLGRTLRVLDSMMELVLKGPGTEGEGTTTDLTDLKREMERIYWLSLRFIHHTQNQMNLGLYQATHSPVELIGHAHIIKQCYSLQLQVLEMASLFEKGVEAELDGNTNGMHAPSPLGLYQKHHELIKDQLNALSRRRPRELMVLADAQRDVDMELDDLRVSLLGTPSAEGKSCTTSMFYHILKGFNDISGSLSETLRTNLIQTSSN